MAEQVRDAHDSRGAEVRYERLLEREAEIYCDLNQNYREQLELIQGDESMGNDSFAEFVREFDRLRQEMSRLIQQRFTIWTYAPKPDGPPVVTLRGGAGDIRVLVDGEDVCALPQAEAHAIRELTRQHEACRAGGPDTRFLTEGDLRKRGVDSSSIRRTRTRDPRLHHAIVTSGGRKGTKGRRGYGLRTHSEYRTSPQLPCPDQSNPDN